MSREAALDLEKLVVFDLETTGLEADCKIVQIAMIRGEKIYQSLVNPGMPIPPESTEIHRITDADVVDAPTFADIVDDVLAFIQDSVLSGFNIRKFDVPVLRREVAATDRPFPPLPILDLFELNQKMNPRTLAWFFQHYTGEPMDSEEAHDAVYDCACTRKGFLGMFEKHPDLPTSLDELTMLAEPERLPVGGSGWLAWTGNQSEPTLTRGKYRGWALSEVARKETSYLDWLCSIDADSATKNIVRLYKNNREGYLSLLKEEHPLRLEPKYLDLLNAMERKKSERYDECKLLAEKTKDASLLFLAAAWAVQEKRPEAKELAEIYLAGKDDNVKADRRINFLKKRLGL
ncbi:3'-5' exonuclease [Acanthopleuribacter pedis]|uniref:3'-5' exonuclease n=1 Tax=Acanthopleuribacter pedis TaxID=442870 RepID=A0A8J7QGZ2_9BACT|nr:3'-5' exonuclease [Acanthopleuribacter pedis]MBO1319970.1 3'-5' exonuclease [Acanthopleuribacter pedis]